jgi:hypothetical protein
MDGLLGQLTESPLLTEVERDPIYQERIKRERARVAAAEGEQASPAHQQLVVALSAYVQYLDRNNRAEDAWKNLEKIQRPTDRPADLVLKVSALTGRLEALLAAYQSHAQAPPSAEQFLSVAAALSSDGHNDLALRLEEYEYSRELQGQGAPAAAYFGLAKVRIEQRRTDEAISLIRDVTLSVGEPFQNHQEAVRLLDQEGLKQNAADFARQWHIAEPWNKEAALNAARLNADNRALSALRQSASVPYSTRARSAIALHEMTATASGSTELDLLTHPSISVQEASQPFFVLSRLRAALLATEPADKVKLYSEAIALSPSLHTNRLHFAGAAFRANHESLGLAAWRSYLAPRWGQTMGKAFELDAADYEKELDASAISAETLRVKEEVAAVFMKRQEANQALPLYDGILAETKDAVTRARIEKLKALANRRNSLTTLNRRRQPKINQELVQPGIVGPRYTALPANVDLANAVVGEEQ